MLDIAFDIAKILCMHIAKEYLGYACKIANYNYKMIIDMTIQIVDKKDDNCQQYNI